jgi:hypothetical protein
VVLHSEAYWHHDGLNKQTLRTQETMQTLEVMFAEEAARTWRRER